MAKKKHFGKFLIICHYNRDGLSAIVDNINMLASALPFKTKIINVTAGASGYLALPKSVKLAHYDGIIIHPTVCYFPENLDHLDDELSIKFKDYNGVKVLIKQDEHVKAFYTAKLIRQKKIDLVVTCLSQIQIAKAYPIELTGKVEYLQAYTGYVSPLLKSIKNKPWDKRRVDIAYRGSIQPLIAGRLGFEKRKIGYDVAKIAQDYRLKIDISSSPQDRILGSAWFDFLLNTKAVLGAESGSNLFDLDGSVQQQCDIFCQNHPELTADSEDIYCLAENIFLSRYENNIQYGQISPRHFEAAACKTVQILYEGDYSGIFVPYIHYLPLKRDLSNFASIVNFLQDKNRCQSMVESAYHDIIINPRYASTFFTQQLSCKIFELLAKKQLITMVGM